ncbi:FAD-linked oxidoreductase-like protein [Gautieria morchelliformis]|nr:FAD-linked oxidoreductase-like protein [Gautieria morchelliformis]
MLPVLRTSCRPWTYTTARLLHSPVPSTRRAFLSRVSPIGIAFLSCGVVGGALYIKKHTIRADSDVDNSTSSRSRTSLSTLLRAYVVYALCSVPVLVDYSPTVLATLTMIPGVKQITEAIVRSTFFAQFVGGDSAEDTIPLLMQLREDNKGVLLAYSVEVDQSEAERHAQKEVSHDSPVPAVYKMHVEEILRAIDIAADFEDQCGTTPRSGTGRKTWVAVKLTALLPNAQCLISLSKHLCQTRPEILSPVPFPGCPQPYDLAFLECGALPPAALSEGDITALTALYHDLTRIAEGAERRGVKIIVDAEYSWYQPAIDAFTLSLMRRFNSQRRRSDVITQREVQPLVYATFQAYLKRTPSHILQSLKDAEAGGYSLGVKLVRGAYHPFEVEASLSPETCPVWMEKKDTDMCYNQCVGVLLSALRGDITNTNTIPQIGLLFGTHNSESCTRILNGLVLEGIATERNGLVIVDEQAAERCAIGQLFGMSDALTNDLVDRIKSPSPFVIKYVPYGPLSAVMPYLSRRAIENNSILSGEGGAIAERRRVGAEIRRRLLGF